MAITWIDGFDYGHATTNPLSARYTVTGSPPFVTGRFGTGQAVAMGTSSGIQANLPAAVSTLSLGFAFLCDVGFFSTAGQRIIDFRTGAGTVILKLGMNGSGQLLAARTDYTTNLILASVPVIRANINNYIEIEIVRNGATGSYKVYLNSIQIINATGVNTGASDLQQIKFGPDDNGTFNIDDFYVTNTSTKLGERKIESLRPTSETAQIDFTPSTGTDNALLVDETLWNGDTDYNASGTAGHYDRYNMGNLALTPGNISAVQIAYQMRKDDATGRTARSKLLSGATTQNGTTNGVPATYGVFVDLYETDPNTAAAWTPTNVNAIEAGLEIVT
jgi:hypothetical protein